MAPSPPAGLIEPVARGTLDAELAALVWWLLEAEVPLIVAGSGAPEARTALLRGLLEVVPAEASLLRFDGTDLHGFDWLPQAAELGWPRPGGPLPPPGRRAAWPGTRLVTPELTAAPGGVWGLTARVLVRSLQLGYSLATSIEADSLRDLSARLTTPPVSLAEDELRRLGLILVLGPAAGPGPARVVAAHYLRPLERDGQGPLQRRPPAVLASWDPTESRFEHFAWGLVPELEVRFGLRPRELERELAERQGIVAEALRPRATAGPEGSEPG